MTVGDLNFVTVHGTYKDMTGTAMTGTIVFTPNVVIDDPESDLIIMPKAFTATLTAGAFTISLPATDDPDVTPVGWSYTVTENIGPLGRTGLVIDVPIIYVTTGVSLATLLATTFTGPASNNYVTLPQANSLYGALGGATWDGVQDFTGATVLGIEPALNLNIADRGAWATATAYIEDEYVTASGQRYVCATEHSSGTFTTDLANGLWVPSGVDASSIVALPANASGLLTNNGSGTLSWTAGAAGGALNTHTDSVCTNTTALTSLGGLTVPTTVAAGDIVNCVWVGDFVNNTGSTNTLLWSGILGATSLASFGTVSETSSSGRRWFRVEISILVVTPASSQLVDLRIRSAGIGGLNSVTSDAAGQAYTVGTENLTAGKTVAMQVQWGTAATTCDVTCHKSTLTVSKA